MTFKTFILALALSCGIGAAAAQELRIALILGKTGPFEAYAKETETGFMLGLEYLTGGKMEIDGRKLKVLVKDDQLKPDLAKAALAEAYGDDKVAIAVGTTSSGAALAMLPVAEEYKKVLIVEPAVADSITGDKWNRYIFRVDRNSSMDAISNALSIGKPGVVVATLAQDYAFGRDGVAAFRTALAATASAPARPASAPPSAKAFTLNFSTFLPAKAATWVSSRIARSTRPNGDVRRRSRMNSTTPKMTRQNTR